MEMSSLALVGNPNSGKTTLFNALTGSNQHIGNWPGVTVERKSGQLKSDKQTTVQDLPGIYSLSPYSSEELITRKYLLDELPSEILDVVDATNLERNLYLTLQLMETGLPLLLILVTVQYLNENNQSIAKPQTISGYIGETYDATSNQYKLTISGYVLDINRLPKNATGKFSGDVQNVTYFYKKQATPIKPELPDTPGDLITSPTDEPTPPTTPSLPPGITPQLDDANRVPNYAASEGAVVYAIKKIGLYKKPDFSNNNRRSWYTKKPRFYRPMFVVTGYKRSTNGVLRYKVRDVNHKAKTTGKTGYITASQKYVRPVYYAAKHSTITVINPRGVNAYRKANLTGRIKNYRQGTALHVKRIVKHNLTTRYVLTNGRYVTANRKLVAMGRHKQVKMVKTKRVINRYRNVNLTKRDRTIAKNRKLKVYGYDYSHGSDIAKHGTLRYRVAGGYITANTKYVRAYK